ncbi:MAG: hypothetical protein JXA82_00700 [Sedimentisphaerales bacterium]|nr:hypothetical protein [Sedimentisphaerales bacterium]
MFEREQVYQNAAPVIMLCDRQGFARKVYPHRRFIPFTLDILGRSLSLSICYDNIDVRLAEIVPMARMLSDMINRQLETSLEGFNKHVSCRRGCSYCCYYMVPVSCAEAFHISREVVKLPHNLRERILVSMQEAGRCLINHRPPNPEDRHEDDTSCLYELSNWYRSLHLACPFLVNHICSIYDTRPLACREYWVFSDPENCHAASQDFVTVAPLPVRIAEVVSEVCTHMLGLDQTVFLPLSLPFTSTNSELDHKTWPAGLLVETFLEVLFKQLHQSSLSANSSTKADQTDKEPVLHEIIQ